MKKQYIVQSNNINERILLYSYLINNSYIPLDNFNQRNFINNKFPFVIESNKTFWICEIITCCAAAVSCGAIITIAEYFDIINKEKSNLVLKLKNNSTCF